jgi:hypothetical protein
MVTVSVIYYPSGSLWSSRISEVPPQEIKWKLMHHTAERLKLLSKDSCRNESLIHSKKYLQHIPIP